MRYNTNLKIIAELGASHCGKIDIAHQLIDDAGQAGATHFKLQTFDPNEMAIPGAIVEAGPWKGRELRDLYRETQTPWKWHPELFDHIREAGMVPMSTPFSWNDVYFLESIGCEEYKIASFEAEHALLVGLALATRKPVHISTGLITNEGLDDLLEVVGYDFNITLLHCVSNYPADMSEANLGRIRMLKQYGFPVGISDHTKGVGAAPLAVALGATIVEKHIQAIPVVGQDRGFALLPHEFADMVKACVEAEQAIYPHHQTVQQASRKLKRSLWCRTAKKKGELYTEDDLVEMRPWSGVPMGDRFKWVEQPASEDHGAWERPR